MDKIDILFDRLAGCMKIYVDNYALAHNDAEGFDLQPSYPVDYDIQEWIMQEISESYKNTNDVWYLQISRCRDINDLPVYIKELVLQFLPRFFEEFPYHKEMDCLKIISRK